MAELHERVTAIGVDWLDSLQQLDLLSNFASSLLRPVVWTQICLERWRTDLGVGAEVLSVDAEPAAPDGPVTRTRSLSRYTV